MAKIIYKQNLDGDFDFGSGAFDLKINQKGTKAVWLDEESGVKITLIGSKFAASEENPDILGAGKFTSATIVDGDDHLVFSVSGTNLKAANLTASLSSGAPGIAYFLASGDDRVVGSNKGQIILGGAGDDVLTGKGGSDTFIFQGRGIESVGPAKLQPEHDVITDFDIKGSDRDILQINYDFVLQPKHGGQDTLLKFEDGSTLLLEGVKKAQFQDYMDSMWQ